MNEAEIIDRIVRFGRSGPSRSVRIGIGDDCAVLHSPESGFELLATTDQVIENRHFLRKSHPPEAVGAKALTRGLSDLAAMGGRPLWFLLSLQLPEWVFNSWLEQFIQGMFQQIDRLDLPDLRLAGGDLAAASQFSAHVTAVGEAPDGGALLRSGAKPGETIYVSGKLGGGALGLEQLRAGLTDTPAIERHLRPEPRLALGETLRERGATAAMDLSDGLSIDLGRLAEASGVQARIDPGALPVFEGASIEQALHGGDDYELLFTSPKDFDARDLDVTPVGETAEGAGVWRTDESRPLAADGYDHFR